MKEISLQTHSRVEMIDITAAVQKAVGEEKIAEGICLVYTPHTTAAITINENADPDVSRDIISALEKIVPPLVICRTGAVGGSPVDSRTGKGNHRF
jgi:secondary thiamine-phosphate synthase enzyme